MDFSELIKKRRAIRDFEDKYVSEETIHEIIKTACLAPNARNDQVWRFVIVTNRDMIKRISDDSKSNFIKEMESNTDPNAKQYVERLKDEKFNVFYNSPCLILVLRPASEPIRDIDCALVASYIMLAAADKGLGTNWIGLGSMVNDPDILNELGITPDLNLVAPIILGYPTQIPPIPERRALQILKVVE